MRPSRAILPPMLFLFSAPGFGQELPLLAPGPRAAALELESTIDVPFESGPAVGLPIMCGPDGAVFVDTVGPAPNDNGRLIAISRDGQEITTFDLRKITDVIDPVRLQYFLRDADLYMLVQGRGLDVRMATVPHVDGSKETQLVSSRRKFIAHFKRDGTYIGAVSLDLPLEPLQFGVFPNGDFLVAGTTGDIAPFGRTRNPLRARVALVKSSGQFNRFIEVKNDIRVRLDSDDPKETGQDAIPWVGKDPGGSFWEVLQQSTILADGRNLLLLRAWNDTPVFSLSPAGEVEAIRLDLPKAYSLGDLKATRDSWVVMYSRPLPDEGNRGHEYGLASLDPKTGKLMETYFFKGFPGFGLACTDGVEFSFLLRGERNFKIVKYTVSHGSSSEAR